MIEVSHMSKIAAPGQYSVKILWQRIVKEKKYFLLSSLTPEEGGSKAFLLF